jgi:hypothetical protein
MKHLLRIALVWLSLCGIALAQSLPPIQTINSNQGISCNAVGSQGAVSLCRPAWSYGCNSSTTGSQILATDGQRTGVLFQDTGTIPIVLVFGDQATGSNGFVVQPGNSFLWSNLGQGNVPGHVTTTAISVISNGASTCSFMFTE